MIDPTVLPVRVTVPRLASGLWWAPYRAFRVASSVLRRPAAVAALEEAVRPPTWMSTRSWRLWRSRILWIEDDAPYVCPPLAGCWTHAPVPGDRGVTLRWNLRAWRPRMNADGAWRWSPLPAETEGEHENPLGTASVEVENLGRYWARRQGLAWIPGLRTKAPVEPDQLLAARFARAQVTKLDAARSAS